MKEKEKNTNRGIFKTPKYESRYDTERKMDALKKNVEKAKSSRVSAQDVINKPTKEIKEIARVQKRDVSEAKFEQQKAQVNRMAKPVFDILRGASYGSHSAKTSFSRGFARNPNVQRRKIL